MIFTQIPGGDPMTNTRKMTVCRFRHPAKNESSPAVVEFAIACRPATPSRPICPFPAGLHGQGAHERSVFLQTHVARTRSALRLAMTFTSPPNFTCPCDAKPEYQQGFWVSVAKKAFEPLSLDPKCDARACQGCASGRPAWRMIRDVVFEDVVFEHNSSLAPYWLKSKYRIRLNLLLSNTSSNTTSLNSEIWGFLLCPCN